MAAFTFKGYVMPESEKEDGPDWCLICRCWDYKHIPECSNFGKRYPDVGPWLLEPQFSQNMLAMTAENLHDKSAIAAQLALRDHRIEELKGRLEKLQGGVKEAADALFSLCKEE